MRLSIIPSDKLIAIDGETLLDIEVDMSWIPSNVHAVQWYGDHGQIEYTNGSADIITELGIYSQAQDTYQSEIKRLESVSAAIEASRDYWEELRIQRNGLLIDSDWIVTFHTEKGTSIPVEWTTYRQALRDLPSNTEDPKNPVWPIKPQ